MYTPCSLTEPSRKRDKRCRFTVRDELKIVDLYQKGLSMRQLSEKFNASLHCIFNILHFYGIRIREPSRGVRLRYNHVSVEPPRDFPWHLKEKFSKLIAVFLLTEGNIRCDGRISLTCKDEVLQRYYITLFRETFDLAPTLKSYVYRGKDTSIYSREALSELLKLCPSYKTHPWNEDISRYLEKTQPTLAFLRDERTDLLKECIRLAMSAEGSVTPDFPLNTIPRQKWNSHVPIQRLLRNGKEYLMNWH